MFKTNRTTESEPLEPVGSKQHKAFIAGFDPAHEPCSPREQLIEDLSKEETEAWYAKYASRPMSELPAGALMEGPNVRLKKPDFSGGTRHPDSQRFHDLLEEIGKMHDSKQGDYGLPDNPFANLAAAGEWGLEPWIGIMVRISDKLRRLQTFARVGRLNNEAALDSLKDIAVYSLAAVVLMEKKLGLPKTKPNAGF